MVANPRGEACLIVGVIGLAPPQEEVFCCLAIVGGLNSGQS